MRPLFAPRRVVEALPEQVVATGAWGGSYGTDPIDGDTGYRALGRNRREVPWWTRERAVAYSIAAHRMNPMARAIIDTYTSFCVGDSGISWQCSNSDVSKVVAEFWDDPYNKIGRRQELELRSTMLQGERLMQMMQGPSSGVVRYAPADPSLIEAVSFRDGNRNIPELVRFGKEGADDLTWTVVQVDDTTGLRDGQAMFWRPFRTTDVDERSQPFLMPVLDWLDNWDQVLSNLMDRTALGRYLVWDVTVQGGQEAVDAFVAARGGLHIPPSGSVEVHNESVAWEPKSVSVGADEDSVTLKAALTATSAGAGLARTWLADPEDANRATSLTMAEPVRRRVGGVQKMWLELQAERVKFVIDRAVAARRLPEEVEAADPRTGEKTTVRASDTVIVTGPEIAAADASITAQVLLNLSTGLEKLQQIGALSPEASKIAARKAWEQFVGIPYRAELDSPEADAGDVATAVDAGNSKDNKLLRLA